MMDSMLCPYVKKNKSLITQYAQSVGYKYYECKRQQVLGPPLSLKLPFTTPYGTEIYCRDLPYDTDVTELFDLFHQAGLVYQIRRISTIDANRTFAFISYFYPAHAKTAVASLNGVEIRKGHPIKVLFSTDNRRLFMGNIPFTVTKDEVWKELMRQGVQGIVDIIMYRSYSNPKENRGFVFVEFQSHIVAGKVRKFCKNLYLWGCKVVVEWSIPLPNVGEDVLNNVQIIYMKHLPVTMLPEEFTRQITIVLSKFEIVKTYKFKDYAFVHFNSRKDAEEAMDILRAYYTGCDLVIEWAKPSTLYTKPWFRRSQLNSLHSKRVKDQGRAICFRSGGASRENRHSTSTDDSVASTSAAVSLCLPAIENHEIVSDVTRLLQHLNIDYFDIEP